MVHIEEVVEVSIAARRPAVRVGLGVEREVDAGESAGGLAAEETGVDLPVRNVSVGAAAPFEAIGILVYTSYSEIDHGRIELEFLLRMLQEAQFVFQNQEIFPVALLHSQIAVVIVGHE